MTTISAQGILASRHAQRPEIVGSTLLLRYPRFIHAEFMTHRVFTRNAASSRAIPVKKIIDDILMDTAMPLHWGKNQKGMQADQECDETLRFTDRSDGFFSKTFNREEAWFQARDNAIEIARAFDAAGYHKQVINRLLEPFAHITVVVTSTQWSNFLALRDHKDAEPHIQILAREVKKVLEEMPVQTLEPGQWHLPFVDWFDPVNGYDVSGLNFNSLPVEDAIKLSVARCASTSYKTVDGFDMTLEKAIVLHDKLVSSTPLHASPAEHQFKADRLQGFNGMWENSHLGSNLGLGWIQYRKTLPGECL